MKSNSGQIGTPSGSLGPRFRLHSIGSPFISPLLIRPSPALAGGMDLMELSQLNNFRLEEEVQPSFRDSNSQAELHLDDELEKPMHLPEDFDDDVVLDENNMLEYILKHSRKNDQKLESARLTLQGYGNQFTKKLFDYLTGKFSKLKKTKEQMVKYCIRKSFKHVTNKMRSANRDAYINMENNEVVAQYFLNHCEGDLSISMPFQKTSEQKTMNSNFLKKIFKCKQYNIDYHDFLKQFSQELHHDNNKKIKSMNQTIKKIQRNKCWKALDQYKRLPWTYEILEKLHQFAKKLTEHSPYKKQQLIKKEENHFKEKNQEQQSFMAHQDQFQIIKSIPKKNSVIILTPPSLRPSQDPTFPKETVDL